MRNLLLLMLDLFLVIADKELVKKVKQLMECGVKNMVLNMQTNIFLLNGYDGR